MTVLSPSRTPITAGLGSPRSATTERALPKLSIGLPVYNGERYLTRAIESMLGQTFSDFDLILCDNASTDATEEICRTFAARDSRIRYHRNETNLGAAPNFNKAYEIARPTAYYKWTAADDEYDPRYLEQCVAALDRDQTVVLAHSQARAIDSEGRTIPVVGGPADFASPPAGTPGVSTLSLRFADLYDRSRKLDSFSPAERYDEMVIGTRRCMEIWGVMRRDLVARTGLHGSYYGTDKVILTWLALAGRFILVPEQLYYRRHHEQSSDSILSVKEREKWMDTRRDNRRTANPRIQCLRGYHKALVRSKMSVADRIRCYGTLARYLVRAERWMAMLREPR